MNGFLLIFSRPHTGYRKYRLQTEFTLLPSRPCRSIAPTQYCKRINVSGIFPTLLTLNNGLSNTDKGHLNLVVVIFLDIDGVLNTRNHLRRQKISNGYMDSQNWCPIACNNIVRLCQKYGADIVVSSTWRYTYDLEALKRIFKENGIASKYVKDRTPSLLDKVDIGRVNRGREIQEWIDEQAEPLKNYLIIDDSADMLEEQEEHFVAVDPSEGFASREAFIEAVEILSVE